MTPNRKRPISVWIAQIILGIYGAGMAVFVLLFLYRGLTDDIKNPEFYVFSTLGMIALTVLFLAGVWGMAIRKAWGRWFGVGGLAFLLVAAAITQTSRVLGDQDSGLVSIKSFVAILVVCGLAFLTYSLAAGDAANNFFEGPSSKDSML